MYSRETVGCRAHNFARQILSAFFSTRASELLALKRMKMIMYTGGYINCKINSKISRDDERENPLIHAAIFLGKRAQFFLPCFMRKSRVC